MGNKTGPLDYLGHPIPLIGGEFGKQDSYVSKGGPLGGEDDFGKPLHLGNGCNLINWQDLGSEYQGIDWVRNFRLIPKLAG